MRKNFSRTILVITALTFIGFGVAFLIFPHFMAERVEIELLSGTASSDIRAVYGGFEIGFGCFLLLCAGNRARVRFGLVAGLLAMLGLATGRTIGIWAEGPPSTMTTVLLTLEVVALLLILVGLALRPPENDVVTRDKR